MLINALGAIALDATLQGTATPIIKIYNTLLSTPAVSVTFPSSQTVFVSNFPAPTTSVTVSNFSTPTSISVNNFPSTQNVNVANPATPPLVQWVAVTATPFVYVINEAQTYNNVNIANWPSIQNVNIANPATPPAFPTLQNVNTVVATPPSVQNVNVVNPATPAAFPSLQNVNTVTATPPAIQNVNVANQATPPAFPTLQNVNTVVATPPTLQNVNTVTATPPLVQNVNLVNPATPPAFPALQNVNTVTATPPIVQNVNLINVATPTATPIVQFVWPGVQNVAITSTPVLSLANTQVAVQNWPANINVNVATPPSIQNVNTVTATPPSVQNVNIVNTATPTATPIVQLGNTALFGQASTISTGNSSTATPLTSGSVFTGTSDDCLNHEGITVVSFADQASASSGLSIQWSQDGSNWDYVETYTAPANKAYVVHSRTAGRYFRVIYTNGGTNQGLFRLQTIKHVVMSWPRSLTSAILSAQQNTSMLPGMVVLGTSVVAGNTAGFALIDGDGVTFPVGPLAAGNIIFNGSSWDRLRGTGGSMFVTVTNPATPAATPIVQFVWPATQNVNITQAATPLLTYQTNVPATQNVNITQAATPLLSYITNLPATQNVAITSTPVISLANTQVSVLNWPANINVNVATPPALQNVNTVTATPPSVQNVNLINVATPTATPITQVSNFPSTQNVAVTSTPIVSLGPTTIQNVNSIEFPTAALLADTTSVPTTTYVGAMNMVYNGASFDLLRGTALQGVQVDPGRQATPTSAGTSASLTQTPTQIVGGNTARKEITFTNTTATPAFLYFGPRTGAAVFKGITLWTQGSTYTTEKYLGAITGMSGANATAPAIVSILEI